MKINNMNNDTMMMHLRRVNWWWVRDHADERSIYWRRIGGVEGTQGLPITTILCGHSNSYHHQIVYLLQADGDARLDCRVHRALELPLGVALIFKGRTQWLKKVWITLSAVSPWSFSLSIASSNKHKCYGSDRAGVLDHDSSMSGCSWS